MEDILLSMQPTKEFLVCVDSDGCVFDNMELKHKECFCPTTVNVWGLQSVSRYARESAESVNLYSKTRGANRFPALIRTLELLGQRKEAQERGYVCPDLTPLKKWVEETDSLSAKGIREYKEAHEAIVREWGAQGLLEHITVVAGQELGTKKECIRKAAEGKYKPENVLMVGDAPGDHQAAEGNGVLFCPIIPGQEVESWSRLRAEAAEKFHKGEYAGEYMENMLGHFDEVLQETPNW